MQTREMQNDIAKASNKKHHAGDQWKKMKAHILQNHSAKTSETPRANASAPTAKSSGQGTQQETTPRQM